MNYSLKILFFLLFVLFGCCHPKQGSPLSDRINIQIELTPWLTFDYRSSTLKLEFRPDDILIDTIQFSVNEANLIKYTFEKNRIGFVSGEHWIGQPKMFPTDQVKMIIYEDDVVKSIFHCTHNYTGRNTLEKEIAPLSNILLNIIYAKEAYKKMGIESVARQEKYGDFLY